MSAKIYYLSKSRLKRGLQCSKSLYFTLFKKELEPEVSAATQLNFDEGNEVGELARTLFKDGVLIDNAPWEREQAAEATAKAIAQGANVIFEASFMADGLFARVDVFKREQGTNTWEVIEVKKSAKLKEEHLEDVALQALTLRAAGIQVEKYQVMHLNPACVYPNLENLFAFADVTAPVEELLQSLNARIDELKKIVADEKEPSIKVGPHCDDPNPCAFRDHCWKDFPKPSVFDLPGIGPVKGWKLISDGKMLITDLNEADYKGKTKTAIQVTKTGNRWIEPDPIHETVTKWTWPIYFLDFETLGPAIPRYPGCSPYSEVPFQFSCHVWGDPSQEVTHFEYLHLDSSDPRPALVDALVKGFGTTGSVAAYSMSVEKRILLRLADEFPVHADVLKSIASRLVDPLPVFQNHVYDPKFFGSFSIKDVAPVLAGDEFNYDKLTVSDGLQSRAMVEKIMKGQVDEATAKELKEALLIYCRQDTIAMVALTKWMLGLKKSA